jgi:phage portal protein BeeE
MRLESRNIIFSPGCIIHFRSPDPSNFYEGCGIVQAGAEYIDNDNYAMGFNRKFFINGARPAGFLETDMVAETQVESLKIGFADTRGGIENINRIAVLPKGVKWSPAGTNPKDMDFKNLSEDMRDRIFALFGVSKTVFVRPFDVQILDLAERGSRSRLYRLSTRYFRRNSRRALVNLARILVVVVVREDPRNHREVITVWGGMKRRST